MGDDSHEDELFLVGSMVDKATVNKIDVDDISRPKNNAVTITPKTIGKQFFICFPKALNPTTVNIPATTGPFTTPPIKV